MLREAKQEQSGSYSDHRALARGWAGAPRATAHGQPKKDWVLVIVDAVVLHQRRRVAFGFVTMADVRIQDWSVGQPMLVSHVACFVRVTYFLCSTTSWYLLKPHCTVCI